MQARQVPLLLTLAVMMVAACGCTVPPLWSYTNPIQLWGDEDPCVVTYALYGFGKNQQIRAVEAAMNGSYESNLVDAFIVRVCASLTPEQADAVRQGFVRLVVAPDAAMDKRAEDVWWHGAGEMWWEKLPTWLTETAYDVGKH